MTTRPIKLEEHTYGLPAGTHIYMRLMTCEGRTEEIDVYITADGYRYHTSADNYITPENKQEKQHIRETIIAAFHELY